MFVGGSVVTPAGLRSGGHPRKLSSVASREGAASPEEARNEIGSRGVFKGVHRVALALCYLMKQLAPQAGAHDWRTWVQLFRPGWISCRNGVHVRVPRIWLRIVGQTVLNTVFSLAKGAMASRRALLWRLKGLLHRIQPEPPIANM